MRKNLSNFDFAGLFARRTIMKIALIMTLGILGLQFANLYKDIATLQFPIDDFVTYWAGSRLQLTGDNPYSPEQLMTLQKSVGWQHDTPLILYNPPWAMPFILPFGLPAYTIARFLWLIFHFALVIFCSDCLWRFYGGITKYRWLAWVVGTTFVPTLWVLKIGQIGPLILFGVVTFLYFEQRQRLFLAGAVSALIAIKPHLLYLFWTALLFWAMDRRRWFLLFGGLSAGLMITVISLIFNPSVISQYLHLIISQPPLPIDWATPTFGTLLRILTGIEKNWLQFVPSIAGLLWFSLYWLKHRSTWDWREQIPLLLLVSVVTTSYCWSFDQVILLPAVIQAATWIFHGSSRILITMTILVYLIINVFAVTLNLMHLGMIWDIWMAPAFLLGYLILKKMTSIKDRIRADQLIGKN